MKLELGGAKSKIKVFFLLTRQIKCRFACQNNNRGGRNGVVKTMNNPIP